MQKHLITIAAISLTLSSLIYADVYSIGEKAFILPTPVGYQNYLGVDKAIDQGIQAGAKLSHNRVLAKFCTKDDFAQVLEGKLAAPKSTFDIQVDTRYEPLDVSPAQFEGIKNEFLKTYKDSANLRVVSAKVAKGLEKSWFDLFGSNAKLNLIPSGVVGTTRRSITHSAFVKVKSNGKVEVSYVIQTIFCIDGKIFNLIQTKSSPTDIDALNKASMMWAKSVESKN